MSGGQQVVASNLDGTILNEVRETIRLIKSETNTLIQKSVSEILKLI
jgi:hydroxymethylpyrimidine pyrophosphatase-like HAD family hydrolase